MKKADEVVRRREKGAQDWLWEEGTSALVHCERAALRRGRARERERGRAEDSQGRVGEEGGKEGRTRRRREVGAKSRAAHEYESALAGRKCVTKREKATHSNACGSLYPSGTSVLVEIPAVAVEVGVIVAAGSASALVVDPVAASDVLAAEARSSDSDERTVAIVAAAESSLPAAVEPATILVVAPAALADVARRVVAAVVAESSTTTAWGARASRRAPAPGPARRSSGPTGSTPGARMAVGRAGEVEAA